MSDEESKINDPLYKSKRSVLLGGFMLVGLSGAGFLLLAIFYAIIVAIFPSSQDLVLWNILVYILVIIAVIGVLLFVLGLPIRWILMKRRSDK
ncbi:MAG: hypothetical protein INQ03_15625 [Candidatus Heimdallarchaeota archaeon]|nr:hypothetical protein [Candidatus Heimdallarchaeota archaeon]